MSELMQKQYDEMLRLAETREIERDDAFAEMKRVRAERDALRAFALGTTQITMTDRAASGAIGQLAFKHGLINSDGTLTPLLTGERQT